MSTSMLRNFRRRGNKLTVLLRLTLIENITVKSDSGGGATRPLQRNGVSEIHCLDPQQSAAPKVWNKSQRLGGRI